MEDKKHLITASQMKSHDYSVTVVKVESTAKYKKRERDNKKQNDPFTMFVCQTADDCNNSY